MTIRTVCHQSSLYPSKVEEDIIIENAQGDCFAIEVKSVASLKSKDFNGLKRFQNVAGERFKFGVLLYDGDHTSSFGCNSSVIRATHLLKIKTM